MHMCTRSYRNRPVVAPSRPAAAACRSPRTRLLVAAFANGHDRAPASDVHDGRLPFLQTLVQFVRPRAYVDQVLQGHKFAWGKTGLLPSKDTLFIADQDVARELLASEWQLGIGGGWIPTMRAMMGHSSVTMTPDLNLHARLRQVLGLTFTKEAVQAMLPGLQATVAAHLARWAAAATSISGNTSSSSTPAVGPPTTANGGMVLGYPAMRLLTFDVLVNRVLGLNMAEAEVVSYAELFKVLVDGFMPPDVDLPFTPYGKGLKARRVLCEHVQETLSGPTCSGVLARLRDEFGASSDVAVDNTINLLFAGFDTTSSSLTFMMWLLAKHPEVLEKVHAEQQAIMDHHGPTFTPDAYRDMTYTNAVGKETMRLAQIIAYLPRQANRELPVPGGPTLPAGCPFLVALANISQADLALTATGDAQEFRPERWLDPSAAKSLEKHQLPFGTGQRNCLGINLAYAEMAVVLAELSRHFTLTADWDTTWTDFPIKRPDNGLPLRLTPRAEAAAGSGRLLGLGLLQWSAED